MLREIYSCYKMGFQKKKKKMIWEALNRVTRHDETYRFEIIFWLAEKKFTF